MKPREQMAALDIAELNNKKIMEEKIIKKLLTKNSVDDLTDALVNVMRYSDNSVEYPEVENAEPDDGVIAEWFYPIYNGTNDFSELTAILMYTRQETKFSEIGELMLGIALTEMKHYAKLGDLIRALGGKITQRYTTEYVKTGSTPRKALEKAISSEVSTIKFYNELLDKISQVKETKTTLIAQQLINKLIADEEVHKVLLSEALSEFSVEEEEKKQELKDKINE